jgi:hypothetical protein
MGEIHPFTVRIETDPLDVRRFRWTVCEGNQIHIRSPHSYATRREAEREANEVMLKHAASQQMTNLHNPHDLTGPPQMGSSIAPLPQS